MSFDNTTTFWLIGLALLLLGFSMAGLFAMRPGSGKGSQKIFWIGLITFHLFLAFFLFRFSPWLSLVPLLPLGAFIPLLWTAHHHQQRVTTPQKNSPQKDGDSR